MEEKYSWFCYIINSQVVEYENVTWSIPIIIPYYAILSNTWRSVTYCDCLVFSKLITADLFNYSQEKMMRCICQSILVQSETNIVLNEWLHYLFERFPWFGALWYNISIPWTVEFSGSKEFILTPWWQLGMLKSIPQCFNLEFLGIHSRCNHITFWLNISGNFAPKQDA